jgi:hypothetical protein
MSPNVQRLLTIPADRTPDARERGRIAATNAAAYEWLVERIRRTDPERYPEAVLREIVRAADFAVQFHTGRFADGAIENIAFAIGRGLSSQSVLPVQIIAVGSPDSGDRRRHVLHVTTRVFGIGGHTRMLRHWALSDASSRHSLALTQQGNTAVPDWVVRAFTGSGGSVVALPDRVGLTHKAASLRAFAAQGTDLVVLHHFGADVVPTVAFANPELPPVAMVNHGDHLFSLGSSVTDLLVNFSTAATPYGLERRFAPRNAVLPVPVADARDATSREAARRALGVEQSAILLCSVGRPEKYRPIATHNFLGTAWKLLERNQMARLYVVGTTPEAVPVPPDVPIHPRICFTGPVEDPSPYLAAADVYLESLPFGSLTALIEAGLAGLPAVRCYSPLFPLLVANDDSLLGVLDSPQSEEEYLQQAERLMHSPQARAKLGERLQKRIAADHIGSGWLAHLERVYAISDGLVHRPGSIPTASASFGGEDERLAQWHLLSGRTLPARRRSDHRAVLSRHQALVMQTVGNLSGARRAGWRALRQDPLQPALWRLLAIAHLGPYAALLRRWLRRSRG